MNVSKITRTIFATDFKDLKENEQFTQGVNGKDLFHLTSTYCVPTVCRAKS